MRSSLPVYSEGQYPTVDWLFLDLNSYFASVEQQDRPELRGRPIGVVPVKTDSTCCIAASYEAKAYGVKTGTMVRDAKTLCPHIEFVEGRPKLYVEYQQKIIQAVEGQIPISRVLSVDEMCCRLMGRERYLPNATAIAYGIKQALRAIGPALRCSIGLAPNSYLAKMAGDFCKPDGMTVLLAKDLPQALFFLKLRDVVGISSAMERRLLRRGVKTVEQLCRLSPQQMREIWGSVIGERMWNWLRGADHQDEAKLLHRSIGKQHVLAPKYRTRDEAYRVGLKLLSNAAAKMRRWGLWARGIGVVVRFSRWHGNNPDNDSNNKDEAGAWKAGKNIHACRDTMTLQDYFRQLWQDCPAGAPVGVAVWLFDLVPDELHSMAMFDDERRDTLSAVMDKINHRFGQHMVYLGGMHGLGDAAPTRIPFFSVPELADF
jgi:DNA polymerase IV